MNFFLSTPTVVCIFYVLLSELHTDHTEQVVTIIKKHDSGSPVRSPDRAREYQHNIDTSARSIGTGSSFYFGPLFLYVKMLNMSYKCAQRERKTGRKPERPELKNKNLTLYLIETPFNAFAN